MDIKGDNIGGDKMEGDKVGGNKTTININSQPAAPDRTPDRNRVNFLNAMQQTIDSFLRDSLHSEVIKLTMNAADNSLLARGRIIKRQTGQADEPLPIGKRAGDIFDESGRALLILGDPGSGKTITLLQVADQLAAEAIDPAKPMPVFLNLSSWGQKRLPLAEWMAEEIFVQYGVGRPLTQQWIKENQFVYLLDGLDEVAEDVRDACIGAVNAFRAERMGTAETALCSRTKEYEKLTARLNLTAAIEIQPLNDAQVDAYLRPDKLEMQAVRGLLKTDPPLRELTRSPLMLNVMLLAYRGKRKAELQQLDSVDARRRHLFDAYIEAMFTHRPLPADSGYTDTEARHWLAEIACNLTTHELSELYLEKLQPDWLPDGKHRRHYAILFGLIVGLIAGLIFGLTFGLSTGLIVGLTFGLTVWLMDGTRKIETVEELQWLPPPPRKLFKEVKDGLIIGLIFGLIIGLVFGLIFGPIIGLIAGLIIGLIAGLIAGLDACFNKRETRQKSVPNQGIRSSRRNLWRMSLLYLLILSTVCGLVFLIVYISVPESIEFIPAIIAGLVSTSLSYAFLMYGGKTVIQHYVLRWVLARQGVLPYPLRDKKLIAYLDAMKERLLLRRVGNGYMFIHRTLLEHFAAKRS